jgi:hypothetical protein
MWGRATARTSRLARGGTVILTENDCNTSKVTVYTPIGARAGAPYNPPAPRIGKSTCHALGMLAGRGCCLP